MHIGLVGDPIRPTVLRQFPASDRATIDQVEGDTLGLYRPQDIGVIGERVVVLDTGNDRAVVFDTLLQPLALIGRSGGGPGELRAPFRMATDGEGELWVGDITNRRLTAYSLTGAYLRSLALPVSIAPFTLMSDGTIVIGAPTERHFAARLDSGGAHQSFAPRPIGEEVEPRAFLPTPLLARTSGDTIHVFDNETGALMKYDPEGHFIVRRLLPEPVLAAALQRRSGTKEQLEGGGLRVLDIPLAKSLKASDDDHLLLMVVVDDVVGLLIDAHSYAARSIVAQGAAQDARWLRSARSAALAQNRIYLVADQHVVVYELSSQRRSDRTAAMRGQ
jgi:hypothetical protein